MRKRTVEEKTKMFFEAYGGRVEGPVWALNFDIQRQNSEYLGDTFLVEPETMSIDDPLAVLYTFVNTKTGKVIGTDTLTKEQALSYNEVAWHDGNPYRWIILEGEEYDDES